MYFKALLSQSLVLTVFSLLVGNDAYPLDSVSSKSNWSDLSKLVLSDMITESLPGESIQSHMNFVTRFIFAKSFAAKGALRQYILWREAENIDSVLEENWTDMDELYPYRKSIYTYGRSNSLVLAIDVGKWDLRDVASSTEEEQQRFVRFVSAKMMEDLNRDTRPEAVVGGNASPTGFPKFDIVLNMEGYNVEKHACPQCVRLQMDIMEKVGSHWSEAVMRIFLANAPDFPPDVRSLIEGFQMRSGIPVELRQGQVLSSRTIGDTTKSVVVYRDWVWEIQEKGNHLFNNF